MPDTMRRWTRTTATLLAVLAGTTLAQDSLAPATPEQPDPESPHAAIETSVQNAALLYYRYWIMGGQWVRESMENWSNDPGWRPDERMANSLAQEQEMIRGFLKAASVEHADWGIEYEAGIGAMLPHLGKLRYTARILSADARRLLDAGEPDAAVERIAAIYRMSNHVREDRVLISALVGTALVSYANNEVEEIIAAEKLTADGRDMLLSALESIPEDDIGGVRGAIMGERDIFLEWVKRTYTGPAAGAAFVREVASLTSDDLKSLDAVALSLMNGDALAQDVDKAHRYYDDVTAIWDLPDALDRIQQLEEVIRNAHYGIVGKILLPSFSKAWESSNKARLDLRRTAELVRNAKVIVKDE